MLIAVLTFAILFFLVLAVGLGIYGHGTVRKQLAAALTPSSESQSAFARWRARPSASIEAIAQPFQKVLPKSSAEMSVVQQRLVHAGLRGDSYINIFYGMKVMVPIALAALVTVTGFYEVGGFFVYALTLGLGFLIPDFVLGSLIKSRQQDIARGLCDFLDLMVVCVEAGLSLDLAVQRTGGELARIHPALADELSLVTLEQRAGLPRIDAWNHLAARTDIPVVRTLVSVIVQADQFGTSIGKTMRTYSETLRVQRRQTVEEQAAKTTVKMVFPLVLFIFPSIFVVTLGPAMISMSEAFATYFGQ